MKQKKPWGWVALVMALLLLLIVFIWTTVDLSGKLRAAEKNLADVKKNDVYTQQAEANAMNQKFLDKFFNYQSTQQRYEGIKSLMTAQGYKATFPSGSEPPTSNLAVKSSLEGLSTFTNQKSKSEFEFLNQFQWATEFKGNKSSQSVIIHTVVSFADKAWKVSDVEFVTQVTGQK